MQLPDVTGRNNRRERPYLTVQVYEPCLVIDMAHRGTDEKATELRRRSLKGTILWCWNEWKRWLCAIEQRQATNKQRRHYMSDGVNHVYSLHRLDSEIAPPKLFFRGLFTSLNWLLRFSNFRNFSAIIHRFVTVKMALLLGVVYKRGVVMLHKYNGAYYQTIGKTKADDLRALAAGRAGAPLRDRAPE
jgi:hypothetical protein